MYCVLSLMHMGRRKKRKNWFLNVFEDLKSETIKGVWTVVFFVLGLFLLLSAVGMAGMVGETVYRMLSILFGVGYLILPFLFFILSISFIRTLHHHKLGVSKILGSTLFFISSLGIVSIFFEDRGGLVGDLITSPLIALFDVYSAFIILLALAIISVLILFDAKLPNPSLSFSLLSGMFKKKEKYEEEEYEYEDEKEYEEGEEKHEGEEEEKKSTLKKVLGIGEKKDEESIPVKPLVRGSFTPPPLSLLEKDSGTPGVGDIKANANIIKRTLHNFGVTVEIDEISIGPTVTQYALKPAEGIRLSKIMGLQNNLELALAAHPIRIEAPIPGRSLIGIEVPNSAKATVGLASMFSSDIYKNSDKPLLITLGKDISGNAHFANLAKMPHILIAGATGSGKSVTIHSMITSLLFRNAPQEVRFIMIDPKRVELTLYNNIPHLLTPVITDPKKTILALKWAAKEMDRRYDVLEAESVRDISSYHKNVLAPAVKKAKSSGSDKNVPEAMPYIVIVIDELADIMQIYPRELESVVVRLAQMSRAVGIHLILSTQRPSVNVITGLIKANIPVRVALQVASQIDSRTILDSGGAEKLLGAGDMLYLSGEMSKPRRLQAPLITETEVKKVTKFLAQNYKDESMDDEFSNLDFSGSMSATNKNIFESSVGYDMEDDLYDEAYDTVVRAGKASTSYLQRKLRVGYARAARLMDMLEDRGIIGPPDGSKPREVIKKEDSFEEERDE